MLLMMRERERERERGLTGLLKTSQKVTDEGIMEGGVPGYQNTATYNNSFVFFLTVVRSKCPSYVGTTGILVQEFKHVFKIITKEDKLKGWTDGRASLKLPFSWLCFALVC